MVVALVVGFDDDGDCDVSAGKYSRFGCQATRFPD